MLGVGGFTVAWCSVGLRQFWHTTGVILVLFETPIDVYISLFLQEGHRLGNATVRGKNTRLVPELDIYRCYKDIRQIAHSGESTARSGPPSL